MRSIFTQRREQPELEKREKTSTSQHQLRRQITRTIRFAAIAAFAASTVAPSSFAQETIVTQMNDESGWTEGAVADAIKQSLSGGTIPMANYTIKTTKGTFSGVLVGGNPFVENPSTVTIDAVLVSLIIHIIQTDGTIVTFDPTAKDPCDGNVSAEYRFRNSPLVVPSDLTFNGVKVGNVQYIDGFMRAQFWDAPVPGNPNRTSYFNPLRWSFASAYTLPPVIPQDAVIKGTPCNAQTGTGGQTATVLTSVLNSLIEAAAIPILQITGVISPTKFVLFLTKHVQAAKVLQPTVSGISGGQHLATGTPVQTWARAAYYKSNDITTASHEIGEWMNDPLVNNPTAPWGHLGSTKGCSKILEVGDPLNGKSTKPPIKLDNYEYHPQELAFFSWFFNPPDLFSYGAGGEFSSNGSFEAPAKPCTSSGTSR